MVIVKQGAEAITYICKSKGIVIKKRKRKSYVLRELMDYLIKTRTKLEVSILKKLEPFNISPKVFYYNLEEGIIVMEYVDGIRLDHYLDERGEIKALRLLGEALARVHSLGISHNDLTTANVIYSGGKVKIIDFGLARFTRRIEDFATDLHTLKESLQARHSEIWEELYEEFLQGYKSFDKFREVLKREEEISKRGRYVKERG
jgi:Kae1-associated kinase Bud32